MEHMINEKLISNLSFPDYRVKNFQFLPEKKELKIDVDGAWLDIKSGIPLGPGFVFFRNWNSLFIRALDGKTDSWHNIEILKYDILDEINDFTVENTVITLSGFGKKTHKWIEWRVENPEIIAQFRDLREYSLEILLNRSATEDERGDAAFDLHRFEDKESIQALMEVASDPSENRLVLKYSAESLGKIFSKGNFYDQKLIDQLTPRAREIVYDIIKNKNPSLLKNS
jgi:hypothetical protein